MVGGTEMPTGSSGGEQRCNPQPWRTIGGRRSDMEMHGGTLSIESTFGEGTTVRVWFPAKPAHEGK